MDNKLQVQARKDKPRIKRVKTVQGEFLGLFNCDDMTFTMFRRGRGHFFSIKDLLDEARTSERETFRATPLVAVQDEGEDDVIQEFE